MKTFTSWAVLVLLTIASDTFRFIVNKSVQVGFSGDQNIYVKATGEGSFHAASGNASLSENDTGVHETGNITGMHVNISKRSGPQSFGLRSLTTATTTSELQVNQTPRFAAVSAAGEEVLKMLTEQFGSVKGVLWEATVAKFGTVAEWFWNSPINMLGQPTNTLLIAKRCISGDRCNAEFQLHKCNQQEDCGASGQCETIHATMTDSKLCIGHSDKLYDKMYQVMIRAESVLDLASLTAPNGRFLAAYRNALKYLFEQGKPITVRFLLGSIGGWRSAKDAFNELMKEVTPPQGFKIIIGMFRHFTWWNHAKIIAVDGKFLFQGGHNLWDDDYLTSAPVHDMSMYVEGDVARYAHSFLDHIWRQVRYIRPWRRPVSYTSIASFPSDYNLEKHLKQLPLPASPGSAAVELEAGGPGRDPVAVISLGRLGGLEKQPQAADSALIKLFEASTKSIKMSLQDLGGIVYSHYSEPIMQALCDALMKDVVISMVLSDNGAGPKIKFGSGAYGNGYTLKKLKKAFVRRCKPRFKSKKANKTECTQRLQLARLRYNRDDRQWAYANRTHSRGFANHAKFYMVDDRIFYLGSHNIYPAKLAEYGIIVDDQQITKEVLDNYWDKLWDMADSQAK